MLPPTGITPFHQQPLNSSRVPESPAIADNRIPILTMITSLALFIIGIVAVSGGWHHSTLSLAMTTFGLGIVRFTFQMMRKDLKAQDYIIEIITALGLIAASGLALQYPTLFTLRCLSIPIIGFNFLQILKDEWSIQETNEEFEAKKQSQQNQFPLAPR